VNLGQIAAIEPQDGGDADLLLHTGQRIPCSRTYREALRERLAAA
jgi:DNA-binding LytR/AlgR family response regulator